MQTSFFAPTFDESPVNSTFVNLLKALTSILKSREYIWRYSRVSFRAAFASTSTTTGQSEEARPAKRARLGEKESEESGDKYVQADEQKVRGVIPWHSHYRRLILKQEHLYNNILNIDTSLMMDATSEPEPPAVAVPAVYRQIWEYAIELRRLYTLIQSSPAIDSHRARLIQFLEKFDEIDTAINDLSLVSDATAQWRLCYHSP